MKTNRINWILENKPQLWISILLCAGVSSAMATPRLVLGTIRGFPGATVEVAVSLRYGSNDVQNVVAFQADIGFDSALAAAGTARAGTALRGHVLHASEPAAGTRRLLAYAWNNAVVTNGTVGTIPFTIPSGVRSNVRLTLGNVIISDASGHEVTVTTTEGAIVIQPIFVRPDDGNVEGYFSGLHDDASYVVQATTNFLQWVSVMTNAPVDSFLEFLDLDAHRHPYRFYRPVPLGGAFGGMTWLEGSQLTLRLLGVAGRSYVIQGSVDLQQWINLRTNVAGESALLLTNTIDPAFPHRFFRLKSE